MKNALFLGLAALLAMTLPAIGFDCAKATTATEKLICSDKQLKSLDDDLQVAWDDLAAKLDKDELKALKSSQRAWLMQRNAQCSSGDDAEQIVCLKKMTGARQVLLAGTPASGPGPGSPMEPFFIVKEGGQRTYAIDISGMKFTAPKAKGEIAFNEAVDAVIKDAPINEEVDFDPPALEYQQTMQIVYAGPELVSALLSVYRYDGGAHPNHYSTSINVSTRYGLLAFDDLFDPSSLGAVAKLCYDRLAGVESDVLSAGDRKERLFEDTPKSLEPNVGDLQFWTFDKGGATVRFSPYAIAAYAMGDFECRLPMAVLAGKAKNPDLLPR